MRNDFDVFLNEMEQIVSFPSGSVRYLWNNATEEILNFHPNAIVITDENIAYLYPQLLKDHDTIVIPTGEDSKKINTIYDISQQLLRHDATRKSMVIGIGGGVITDITGFIASIFMRGVKFGFIPTTLLAMVDAAIGGKNGVNTGQHKNILGTITQPQFIGFDTHFLNTLSTVEWSNGFAEVIKYACLKDKGTFDELSQNDIGHYQTDATALSQLIKKCVAWKNEIVIADEHETGQRKLLNFGHTAAHAIEKLYNMPHGRAVAIGMMIACKLSEIETGLRPEVTQKLIAQLQQYQLPTAMAIDPIAVMGVLKSDKKRNHDAIDYILLEDIGEPIIKPLSLGTIQNAITSYAGNH